MVIRIETKLQDVPHNIQKRARENLSLKQQRSMLVTRAQALRGTPRARTRDAERKHDVKVRVLARAPRSSFSDEDACYVRGADGLPLEAEWSPICEHRGLAPVLYVEQVMTSPAKCLNENMTIEKALQYFMKEKISGCPVIDDEGDLVGVLSMTDLIWHEAAAEAHGTKHWIEEARNILNGTVKDEMNHDLVTVGPYELVSDAAKIMLSSHVSRLPVVVERDDGKVEMIGIITRLDVMRCMAATLVEDT